MGAPGRGEDQAGKPPPHEKAAEPAGKGLRQNGELFGRNLHIPGPPLLHLDLSLQLALEQNQNRGDELQEGS